MSIDAYTTMAVFCNDAAVWKQYHNYIRHDLLAEVASRAIEGVGEYYEKHPTALRVTLDEFELWYMGRKKMALPMIALSRAFFEKVRQANITPTLVDTLVHQWIENKVTTELQDALNGVRGGKPLLEHIEQAQKTLTTHVASPTALALGVSSPLLAPLHSGAPGYEWSIEELNISLGPARLGDFILVGACPEMGKTSFCIAQAMHWITSSPAACAAPTVLILNNEEETIKLRDRCLTAVTGLTGKEVNADLDAALHTAEGMGVDDHTLKFKSVRGMYTSDIDRLVTQLEPDVVIINRLDKILIREKRNEGNADRYGRLGLWARNLAATGCVVFGIIQAGDEAKGQRKVYANSIYGSKTLLQGEADAIILLGGEGPDDPIRGVNIPKNKLMGGPRSVESSRHAFCEITFDPARCVFRGGNIAHSN